MARKLILLCAALLFCFGRMDSQEAIECQTKLLNFHEKVKAKKYDEAYKDWLYVKTNVAVRLLLL